MKQVHKKRSAFSLLEMLIAAAILSTVMTSAMVLVRTSYTVWEMHEKDLEQTESICATLRHLARQIKQAEAVTAMTIPSNTTGGLSLLMPDGSIYVWQRNGSNQVYYGATTANSLLAESITELTFTGYKADGVTQTTNVNEIQLIDCRAKTILAHNGGEDFVMSVKSWIRAW